MNDLRERLTWRHGVGVLLFALAVGSTVWLGILASSDNPPSGAGSALLVLTAGIFQVSSASVFHSIGRADPGLARSAVRRLLLMASRATRAEAVAQDAFENGNATALRNTMGVVSVHLSHLQEDALAAVEDWAEFHALALKELVEEASDDGTN